MLRQAGPAKAVTRAALAGLLIVGLAACGSEAAPPPAEPTVPEEIFGAEVPTQPGTSMWKAKVRGVRGAATSPGIVALSSAADGGLEQGEILGLDARTGQQRWAAKSANLSLILGENGGPAGGDVRDGLIFATDDTLVPQAGLTPASTSTEMVARRGSDGATQWRTRVLLQPVRDEARERVIGGQFSNGVVAIATTRAVMALDARTGSQLWRTELPAEGTTYNRPVAWKSFAAGPQSVVAGANLAGDRSHLRALDLRTGRQLWQVTTPVRTDGFSPSSFDHLAIARGRVVANYSEPIPMSGQVQQMVAGYSLDKGRQVWRVLLEDENIENPGSFTFDAGDGTVLVARANELRAFNVQNGRERWKLPPTVQISSVTAADGLTYLKAASGEDQQIVVLRTRTGQQQHTLDATTFERVYLFDGAVLLAGPEQAALYR